MLTIVLLLFSPVYVPWSHRGLVPTRPWVPTQRGWPSRGNRREPLISACSSIRKHDWSVSPAMWTHSASLSSLGRHWHHCRCARAHDDAERHVPTRWPETPRLCGGPPASDRMIQADEEG